MNGSIKVSAKTVDDAITEALIQLGVTSDQLDYEVIEKGSAGFLGIGVKQAVIEARRKIIEKEPVKEVIKEVVRKPVKEVEKVQKELVKVKSEKEISVKEEKKVKEPVFVKKEVELSEVTEETKSAVVTFLQNTLSAMNMEVEITSNVDNEGVLSIDMKGENMGILIGKRGQTLDSLQYLANRVANKHQEGYVRVKLDTENYRKRRQETLENLAKNIAFKVKRTRHAVSLEPMNPYERRIIHAALQGDSSVTTHSEGEEPYRKVVVTLKK